MELPDIIEVEARKAWQVDSGVSGNEVGHFGESINNNKDGVKAMRERETSDEVNRDDLPRTRRGCIGLELANRFARENLGSLTLRTCAHIMSNICSNVGPPVIV